MKKKYFLVLVLIITIGGACTKVHKFVPPEKTEKPIQVEAQRIYLHEDYIVFDNDELQIKPYFLKSLQSELEALNKYEVFYIPSGSGLPKVADDKPSLWITGELWSHQGTTNGNYSKVTTLSESSETMSRSWDVLETVRWNKKALVAFSHLHFIEISSTPEILKSSIAAANIETGEIVGDHSGGSINNTMIEFEDPDKETKSSSSLFGDASAQRMKKGYERVVVGSFDNATNELAQKSVKTLIKGL